MAKRKHDDIVCEINDVYAITHTTPTIFYGNVTWNNGEPRDEIRLIYNRDELPKKITKKCYDAIKLGKGFPISRDAMREVVKAFHDLDEENDMKAVDFNKVFSEGNEITHQRNSEGFIKLTPKSDIG